MLVKLSNIAHVHLKVKTMADTTKKEITPGIIYLSRIPPHMAVKHVRHLLSKYGELGRVYLQSEGKLNIAHAFWSTVHK